MYTVSQAQGIITAVKTEPDPDLQRYLTSIGEKVRAERAKRGMTRRILARDSGVSERYLAQLESGTGNPSIALLRQVCAAMDVPLTSLIAEDPASSSDPLAALFALARSAGEEEKRAVQRALEQILSPAESRRKGQRVALIGLRGGGKSTLGRMLAEARQAPFVELNRLVEQEYGGSVGEILALNGQPAFRRYERRCLEKAVGEHEAMVLSTAGGIVSEPSTFAYLLEHTHTVWIKARPEEHMARVVAQGDLRPMARNAEAMDDLKAILAAREPDYRRAEGVVDTSGQSVAESAQTLVSTAERLTGRPE